MPLIGPRTDADRAEHTRANVIPAGGGDASLQPSNYHENYTFQKISARNDPEGFRVGVPAEPDGYYYFISEVAKGADTLAAQNTASLSLKRPSFFASQPWVAGPPPKTATTAAKVRTPAAPLVQLVDSGQMGFNAGNYLLAYGFCDDGDRRTPISAETPITVPTNNYSIRVTLPSDQIEGAKYLDLYMTPQNGDASQFYLQRKIDVSRYTPESYLLSGPFRFGDKPATTNETFLGVAASPRIVYPAYSPGMVLQPGFYQFAITWITRSGESFASGFALGRTISVGTPRLNNSIAMYRPTPPKGVIGWRAYVLYTMDPGGFSPFDIYTPVWIPRDPSGERYFPIEKEGTHVNGFTGSGGGGDSGGGGGGLVSGVGTYAMVSRQPPIEDTSGIETPDAPLEDPTYEGTQVLDPGPYYFAVAHALRDDMGLPSPPVQTTVTAGKLPRILPADPVNYFPNPEGIEVDLAGKPFDHTFTPGLGSISINAGVIAISSNGAQTTSSPVHKIQSRPIDTSKEYLIGEDHFIWSLVAGSSVINLEQLDASGVVVVTNAIKIMSAAGLYQIRGKMRAATGTEGQGVVLVDGTHTFHAQAATVRLSHEMSGATRNMDIRISNIFATPTAVGQPRKRVVSPTGSGLPANTNPTPEVPFPNVASSGVELPPAATAFKPIQALSRVDFETGVMPSDWSVSQTGTVTATVGATGKIDGSYGLRVTNASGQKTKYTLRQTFTPANRTQIAVRFKMRPTMIWNDNRHVLGFAPFEMYAADGTYLFGIEADPYNASYYFLIRDTSKSSGRTYKTVRSSMGTNEELDYEFLVSYDATQGRGTVKFLLGKNGASRQQISSWTSIKWGTNKYPLDARIGVAYTYSTSSHYLQNYTLDFDGIAVTESGDSAVPIDLNVSPPPLEPLPTPDRPTFGGTILSKATFEGGVIDAGWGGNRSPSDATTTLAVQTASAIEGVYGVRCTDANTTTTAFAYIANTAIPGGNRPTGGFLSRYRVVALPSGGTYTIIQLDGSSGNPLGDGYLTNVGDLFLRAYNSAGTVVFGPQKVASGITSGMLLDIELIAYNSGSVGGVLACWVTKGTGPRQLMAQPQSVNWATSTLSGARAGLISSSSAGATCTLDVDTLTISEEGSIEFEETTPDGQLIYQTHCYFPEGTPVQQHGLFLETDEPISVEPGKSYEAAVTARMVVPTDQLDPALPFFYSARDTDGQVHPLGCVYGDAGVRGVVPWGQVRRQFTTPPDCYEVFMESRNIGSGEFVAQTPVWSGDVSTPVGQKVPITRTFPTLGSMRVTIDCRTRFPQLPLSRKWIDIREIYDVPEGSTLGITYQSSPSSGGPFSAAVTNVIDVPQDNFLHVTYTFTSDTKDTPLVRPPSPLLDYILYMAGRPADVLLRGDGTEFDGGVLLSGVFAVRNLSNFDIRLPRTDRTLPYRINDPVAKLPPFTINAYTEEAATEIEETSILTQGFDDAAPNFMIDSQGRRMSIKFRQPVSFDWGGARIVRYDRSKSEPVRRTFPLVATIPDGTEVYNLAAIDAAFE